MIGIVIFYFLTKYTDMETGSFKDPRDGQTYKTAKLKDGNIWMTQNLNYDTKQDCYFYDDDSNNGEKYGRLYKFTDVIRNKVCPPGWHIASQWEWNHLIKAYTDESESDEFTRRRETYRALTKGGSSGFDALLAGELTFNPRKFMCLGQYGYFWSNTKEFKDLSQNYYLFLFDSSCVEIAAGGALCDDYSTTASIRCIKD